MSKEDPYVVCPYNKSHWVSRSRLQAHVVKCEKKYPKLGICPYNATHRVPQEQLEDHIKNCPHEYKFISHTCIPKVTESEHYSCNGAGEISAGKSAIEEEWDD